MVLILKLKVLGIGLETKVLVLVLKHVFNWLWNTSPWALTLESEILNLIWFGFKIQVFILIGPVFETQVYGFDLETQVNGFVYYMKPMSLLVALWYIVISL